MLWRNPPLPISLGYRPSIVTPGTLKLCKFMSNVKNTSSHFWLDTAKRGCFVWPNSIMRSGTQHKIRFLGIQLIRTECWFFQPFVIMAVFFRIHSSKYRMTNIILSYYLTCLQVCSLHCKFALYMLYLNHSIVIIGNGCWLYSIVGMAKKNRFGEKQMPTSRVRRDCPCTEQL